MAIMLGKLGLLSDIAEDGQRHSNGKRQPVSL